MSITYFLMLLFVFITLFCVSVRWLGQAANGAMFSFVAAMLWASLGTFFFHNIW